MKLSIYVLTVAIAAIGFFITVIGVYMELLEMGHVGPHLIIFGSLIAGFSGIFAQLTSKYIRVRANRAHVYYRHHYLYLIKDFSSQPDYEDPLIEKRIEELADGSKTVNEIVKIVSDDVYFNLLREGAWMCDIGLWGNLLIPKQVYKYILRGVKAGRFELRARLY